MNNRVELPSVKDRKEFTYSTVRLLGKYRKDLEKYLAPDAMTLTCHAGIGIEAVAYTATRRADVYILAARVEGKFRCFFRVTFPYGGPDLVVSENLRTAAEAVSDAIGL